MDTLKETSKDDSVSPVEYMTESTMFVINYNKVKRRYLNNLGLSEE